MLNNSDQNSFSCSNVHRQLGQETIADYKLLLLGHCGVGATSLLKRYKIYESQHQYFSDLFVISLPLTFLTSHGRIRLTVWDFDCHLKIRGVGDIYLKDADCAILMFDLRSRLSYCDVPGLYRNVKRVCGNIPMVLVGNKVDCLERKLRANDLRFGRKKYLENFEISAKANYQIHEPFLYLMRRLVGDPELEILEGPELELPEIEMKDEHIARIMDEKSESFSS
jgi:GTP-binding nuclear protein Ran